MINPHTIAIALLTLCLSVSAQEDSTATKSPQRHGRIKRIIDGFSDLDTTYVEPNHYNMAFMLQSTVNFEWLNIRTETVSLNMSPDPTTKLTPYIGWRWIFLGYGFLLNDNGYTKSSTTEFELSFYTNLLCGDFIYRETGDLFKWRQGLGANNPQVPTGEYSGGVSVCTQGVNLYYIFNRRRFSYPSLFAQSTVQKKSCGTWSTGISVTRHTYNFDMHSWPDDFVIPDSNDKTERMRYLNYAINFGYAYNWVIRKNLMFGISVSPAIGYKKLSSSKTSQTMQSDDSDNEWWGNNINFDVTGRAALVWNNNKYFAGTSFIVHSYNFRHNGLGIHNTFGTLNFYVGLNFIRRHNKK